MQPVTMPCHPPQGPPLPAGTFPANCELLPYLESQICQAHEINQGYKAIACSTVIILNEQNQSRPTLLCVYLGLNTSFNRAKKPQ